MTRGRRLIRAGGVQLSADLMMGVAGGCLALASTSFGIYMTVHGPVAGFGTSHDFTVFAQLAPRSTPRAAREASPSGTAQTGEELDMTATASIPKAQASDRGAGLDDKANPIIASALVEVATDDTATISIDGHMRTVRVGDTVPDAGDVVAIMPGPKPAVKTTRGLILSSNGL